MMTRCAYAYFLTAGQLLFDVRGFGWVWVGLGQLFGGLGWAGSVKIDPRTTLIANTRRPSEQSKVPLFWNISTVLI